MSEKRRNIHVQDVDLSERQMAKLAYLTAFAGKLAEREVGETLIKELAAACEEFDRVWSTIGRGSA